MRCDEHKQYQFFERSLVQRWKTCRVDWTRHCHLVGGINANVSDFIQEGKWQLPSVSCALIARTLNSNINDNYLAIWHLEGVQDQLVW